MALTPQGRVTRSPAGSDVVDDLDFDFRFRQQRLRRWARGIRNGMSPWALARYHLGLSDEIRFRGVSVCQAGNQATYRTIEDVWMRGEYDIAGFVPQPGWRLIDIGANAGVYTMLSASRGARIVAYEPAPDTFERLRANTARWGVDCRRAAVVGAPRATVRLFLHPLRDTRNTMFGAEGGISDTSREVAPTAPIAFDTSIEVPAVPITEVLAEPCDLLKVSCEGAEFEIFAQARSVLPKVARIILELHGELRTAHGGAEELVRLLRDARFDVQVRDTFPGMSRKFLTAVRR
jgi:FkbM family methyltransferase